MNIPAFIKKILPLLLFGSWVTANAAPQSDDDELRETVIGVDQRFVISTDSLSMPEILSGVTKGVRLDSDPILSVLITGRSSIDGPEDLNNRLATARANKIREALIDKFNIDPAIIVTKSVGEDWEMFKRLVNEDPAIPARDEVIRIMNSSDTHASKEAQLKALQKGETWLYLNQEILPAMRSVSVAWQVLRPKAEVEAMEKGIEYEPQVEVVEAPPVVEAVEPEPECEAEVITVVAEPVEEWVRKMYIKTNVPAWALLWQNLALEIDLAPHWSFSVPVYWSPYNYGKQQLKFRTLAVVPEFRYWPKADNMGFFVNAHFGMAYYNYAKNEEYRYQDHDGKTPALGGGLGIGYRFYFCKNHHWAMEAAVGGGVYRLDYDIFMNTPSTSHGYLVGRRKHTFFGVDQAAFSISYSFGL